MVKSKKGNHFSFVAVEILEATQKCKRSWWLLLEVPRGNLWIHSDQSDGFLKELAFKTIDVGYSCEVTRGPWQTMLQSPSIYHPNESVHQWGEGIC
jgi:hypothetical protein